MNDDSAKTFANEWNEGGGESGDYQDFWRDLLHDVFGVEKTTGFIKFQKPIGSKHIDAYIIKTRVLIEHKSFGVDLNKKILQSDGMLLTPRLSVMQSYCPITKSPVGLSRATLPNSISTTLRKWIRLNVSSVKKSISPQSLN